MNAPLPVKKRKQNEKRKVKKMRCWNQIHREFLRPLATHLASIHLLYKYVHLVGVRLLRGTLVYSDGWRFDSFLIPLSLFSFLCSPETARGLSDQQRARVAG
jgi:hypothetical protein